jgi:hypothetical protein
MQPELPILDERTNGTMRLSKCEGDARRWSPGSSEDGAIVIVEGWDRFGVVYSLAHADIASWGMIGS